MSITSRSEFATRQTDLHSKAFEICQTHNVRLIAARARRLAVMGTHTAAIDRVGRELVQTYPHLGANLHLVTLELRAGQTLVDALENLSHRLGIDEVASLAVLLRQSEELGTSLAEALRVYSLEMRDKRLSRAEEKAHALPVKLTIPLGIFIFPVMLVFIMLPLVLRMKGAFF